MVMGERIKRASADHRETATGTTFSGGTGLGDSSARADVADLSQVQDVPVIPAPIITRP